MKQMFSLKKQIRTVLSAAMVLIFLTLAVLLGISVVNYQNNNDQKRMDDLEEYAEVIDSGIAQLNDVLGNIYATNDDFEMLDGLHSPAEECGYYKSLINLMQLQVKSNQNIKGLFIYYDYYERMIYYVNKGISFTDKEAVKKSGQDLVKSGTGSTYEENIVESGGSLYFSQYMKLSSSAVGGTILLNNGYPENGEKSAVYGIIYQGNFYPVSGDTLTLSEEELDSLAVGKNKLKNRMVYMYPSESTDINVVEILPVTPFLYVSSLHIVLFFAMLLLLGLFMHLNKLITVELTRPLEDMTEALGRIQAGQWELEYNAENHISEIEDVKDTVRLLLKEVEHYKIKSYEEEIQRQNTQLQYYQLQLSPHFYTNCLKNAYYMLIMKEYGKVENFLLYLSAHLRYLLKGDRPAVTVADEMEFVENYIHLQNLLASDSILLEAEVGDACKERKIPSMAIQTFVENSVKYAKKDTSEKLIIRIRAKYRSTEEGDFVDIAVEDNGSGYPKEILSVINKTTPQPGGKLGVGIINLESRMKLLYGDKVSWYFCNSGAEGKALSEIIIPVDEIPVEEIPVTEKVRAE